MLPQLPQEFDAWNQDVSDGKRDESPEDVERDAILTFIDSLPYSIERATELKGFAQSKNGRAINADEHEKVVEFVFRRLRFGVEWCVEKKIGTLKWLDYEIGRYTNGLKESALRQSKPFRPPSPEGSAVWLLVILKQLASGDTATAKQMLRDCGPGLEIKDTVQRLRSAILKEHEAIYHPKSIAESERFERNTEQRIPVVEVSEQSQQLPDAGKSFPLSAADKSIATVIPEENQRIAQRVAALERKAKLNKPPTKTEVLRNQRIKFCCPRIRRNPKPTWSEISLEYQQKYPEDKKAYADTLQKSHDRNCEKCKKVEE